MLFVAPKITRAQTFSTTTRPDLSYHMLNRPSKSTAAWDRSTLGPSWQGYVRSHWNSLEVNDGHQGELGNWAWVNLSHVFNIHLGMLLQDLGITWAILSQESSPNMSYRIHSDSRSWAHWQHWTGIVCEMVKVSGSCHGPYWMCHSVVFLVVAGNCRGEPRGPLGLCSSEPFHFLSEVRGTW